MQFFTRDLKVYTKPSANWFLHNVSAFENCLLAYVKHTNDGQRHVILRVNLATGQI